MNKRDNAYFQITCAIIQRLIDDNKDLHSSTYARFLHLGLGLCFLGKKLIHIYLMTKFTPNSFFKYKTDCKTQENKKKII